MALNQVMSGPDATLTEGGEVAFFPRSRAADQAAWVCATSAGIPSLIFLSRAVKPSDARIHWRTQFIHSRP